MTLLPATHASYRLRAALVLLLVSAAAAAAIGLAAWHLLPYEALSRESPTERFLLWEAVMWLSGLALASFGVAAWFGATDLYARHTNPYLNRFADHIHRQVRQGVRGQGLFSDLPAAPWLMMGTGTLLLLLAAVMRSVGFG